MIGSVFWEPASVRVARGVEILDRLCPDWFGRIDRKRFTIRSCTECILGQLYGDFVSGALKIGLEHPLNQSRNVGVPIEGTCDTEQYEAMMCGFDTDLRPLGPQYPRENNHRDDAGPCYLDSRCLNAEWLRVIDERLASQVAAT